MVNLLHEYMNKRFGNGKIVTESPACFGPVITISRQTGCGASKLAHDLSQLFNSLTDQPGKQEPWRFINREIIEKSAEKLNLEPQHLHKVLTDKERGIMDQIVEALSTHSHKSDRKIMNTMQEVIRQFAEKGNVVIVGRGGAVVSHDIERSLHIRLEAPIEWRTNVVMNNFGFSRAYSLEYIHKTDEEREMYVQRQIQGKHESMLYDVILNPSRFNHSQMVEVITTLAKVKKII